MAANAALQFLMLFDMEATPNEEKLHLAMRITTDITLKINEGLLSVKNKLNTTGRALCEE